MSTLSASEIEYQRSLGHIQIEPFDPKRLGPNSYDVTLGDKLCVYSADSYTKRSGPPLQPGSIRCYLDPRKHGELRTVPTQDDVWWLEPGTLYLGRTTEIVGCPLIEGSDTAFVPMLEGKSGVGRLGIEIHKTAGFGDSGFHSSTWTLEITVVEPTILIPGMLIGQVFFQRLEGKPRSYADGTHSYQGQIDPTPSRLWKTFKKDTP